MTKEDIDRIASEYFDDKESEHEMEEVFDLAEKALEKQMQEQETAHWIPTYGNVKCSVCGSVKDSRNVGKATHYCDFCGAKMIESQESEYKEQEE